MTVIIDGDACPVKEIIYTICERYQVPVTLVTSYDHSSNKVPENVNCVYVDRGQDSADFKIISLLHTGDILVTQDYGLASLALPKKVRVVHHSGKEYTQATIDMLLESRHFSAKMRQSGQRTKGPKKFSEASRQKFAKKFEQMLDEVEE
ncbi:hypothetical protein CBF29_05295 [Vagococcus elongatus]|uniref:UPF0178 protein CBF29_05295 n=1 Tax=Vagococcus elongatus TaxID=180344 RepID=A0A430AYH8_9ENTE|nr:YaiI/YqxD family protein [Vagococcus elongatus]RSU13085.1 hypothetical protein CBF29_05295 [Vagococcus elongatus]